MGFDTGELHSDLHSTRGNKKNKIKNRARKKSGII